MATSPESEAGEAMAASPERFDPASMGGLIASEHLARYRAAASVAAGRRVLDAACGLGYGTAILAAAGSHSATGVDISEEAVAAAAAANPALDFRRGDLLDLPFAEASFDLVVCFEAIEHVADPAAALAQLRRVLAPDGLLVVSSPSPANYPQGNPHHVRELSPAELASELGALFGNVELMYQHVWYASALLRSDSLLGRASEIDASVASAGSESRGLESFSLALAGDGDLPRLEQTVHLAGPITQRQLLELAELQRTAAHARNIVASRSWKLTRPLRALSGIGRRR